MEEESLKFENTLNWPYIRIEEARRDSATMPASVVEKLSFQEDRLVGRSVVEYKPEVVAQQSKTQKTGNTSTQQLDECDCRKSLA